MRVEKKFIRNWAYRVSKEAESCAEVLNLAKGKKDFTEKLNF
jgi:hypothetical protein